MPDHIEFVTLHVDDWFDWHEDVEDSWLDAHIEAIETAREGLLLKELHNL